MFNEAVCTERVCAILARTVDRRYCTRDDTRSNSIKALGGAIKGSSRLQPVRCPALRMAAQPNVAPWAGRKKRGETAAATATDLD
jgi:hypothetical protein